MPPIAAPRFSSAFPASRPVRASKVPEYLGWSAVLGLAYFLAGMVGLTVPYFSNTVTLFWPPTGIAVAGLLLWGQRYWPGVWIGSFLLGATLLPWWAAFGVAVGNTAGPYLAAVASCAD